MNFINSNLYTDYNKNSNNTEINLNINTIDTLSNKNIKYLNPTSHSNEYIKLFYPFFSLKDEEINSLIVQYKSHISKNKNIDLNSVSYFLSKLNINCFIIEGVNLIEDCLCDISSELIFISKDVQKEVLLETLLLYVNTLEKENSNITTNIINTSNISLINHVNNINIAKIKLLSRLNLSFKSDPFLSYEKTLNIVLLVHLFFRMTVYFKLFYGFIYLDDIISNAKTSNESRSSKLNSNNCNDLNKDSDKSLLELFSNINNFSLCLFNGDEFNFDIGLALWEDRMLCEFPENYTLQNTYYEVVKYLFCEFDEEFILLFTSLLVTLEEGGKINKQQSEFLFSNRKVHLPESLENRILQIFSLREFEKLFFDYLLN